MWLIHWTFIAKSGVCIQHFMSHYCAPYSERGATLGSSDPIVTAGEEKEYKVESILRHCQQGGRTEILGALALF